MRAIKYASICLLVVLALALLLQGTLPQVPTGTWTPSANLLEARSGSAAVALQDGRILFTGGTGANGALSSAELFNTDGSVSSAAPMQSPRTNHSAVVLQDGRVLVSGGTTSGGGIINAAEIYDPSANAWTPVPGGMMVARSGHTASLLKDGTVLVAGGQSTSFAANTLEVYSPATGVFTLVSGTLSSPRQQHAAAVLGDGRVLIAGGTDGSNPLNTADIYDPVSGIVSSAAPMSSPRVNLSATALLDGRILVAGGSNGAADLATAEIFDPATGTFTPTGSLATARSGHVAFLLPNNNGVLIAGGTSAGAPLSSAELFYPWTGAFSATGAMAVARSAAAGAASNQPGVLLVAGGSDGTNPLASGDLYGFATVKTDKADYAPGEIVTITGTGWQPGETVTLSLVESPLLDTHGPFTVVADSFGNFSNVDFSPDAHDVDIRFYLTATGTVSLAQTSFTDAKPNSVTVTAQSPNPVAPAGSTTYGITIGFNGNSQSCTANLTVTTTLPVGATASFNPSSLTSTGPNQSSTLTISTTSTTPPGSTNFTVQAAGTGAACNGISATGTGTLVVVEDTTTGLTSSMNPSTFGQSTTLTATVAQTTGPTTPNAGTVTFKDAANTLGTVNLNASGVATLSVSNLFAGSHTLTASYAGNALFGASNSSAVTQVVNQASTTTTLNSSAIPSVFGQSVTFTANVAAVAPGSGIPSGTVTFKDGVATLGTANLNVSGVATISSSALSTSGSPHSITATYNGDTNFTGSTSSAISQIVNPAATTTTITTNLTTATVVGQAYAVAYTVVANAPGSGTPTGNVTVSDGSQTCTATVAAGQCSLTSNSPGAKTITATYATDGNFSASTSAGVAHTVNKAATTTTITTSLLTATLAGQGYTVAYTVTVNSPGSGTPSGNVTVSDGTDTCTGTVAVGQCLLTSNTPGAKTITATYAGDTNFNTSTSAGVAHNVNQAPAITSANSTTFIAGSAGSFTATATGFPAPTFSETGPLPSGVTLSSAGVLSGTPAAGTGGTYPITITASNGVSPNATQNFTLTVNQAPAITSANSTSFVVNTLSSFTITASGFPAPTFSETGTLPNGVNLSAAGVLSGTPTVTGNFPITIKATNGVGADATQNFTLTVGQAPAITSANNATFTVNSPGTFTATATGFPAPTFSETGALPNVVGLSSAGVLSGSPALGTVGTYPITITAHNGVGTDATQAFTLTVAKLTPTFSALAASPATIPYGTASITLSGRVNGYAMMPGTVTATINGVASAPVALVGNPNNFSITFDTHAIPASAVAYPITYTYSGDVNSNSAINSSTTLTVNKASTTTVVGTISPEPSNVGQPYSVGWTVTPQNGGTPTGTVTVDDGHGNTCFAVVAAGTCSLASNTPGANTITATYSGDSNFNGSSGTKSHTVNNPTTVTMVASSKNPSTFGDSVTFTATVTSGSGTPAGSAIFYDGGTCQAPGTTLAGPTPLDVNGQAAFSTSALTVPSHTILACYSPTGFYLASFGSVIQTITQASQTITFGALANKTYGDPDFMVSATASSGLAVSFTAAGQCMVSGNLVHITDAGSCTITAHQPGDNNHAAAADVPQSFNIAKAATQTMLASGGNPSVLGHAVTFTATVTSVGGTPGGTVFFFDGTTLIGSAPLSSGSAIFSTALLSIAGSPHSITAIYNGSTDYSASPASNAVAQAISSRGTTTAVALSASSVQIGQPSTATFTVTDEGRSAASGTFVPVANGLNTGRVLHSATQLPDGTILVTGGQDSSGNILASGERYDPTTGMFSAAPSLNTALAGHTSTLLNNGTVLIVGGSTTGTAAGVTSSAVIFDPSSGLYTSLGVGLSKARYGHTATLLANGKVLIAGGQDSSGNPLSSTEVFDPSGPSFSGGGALNAGRAWHTATLLPSGKVLVAGGSGLASAELYDPAAKSSIGTGAMSTDRTGHAAALQPDGTVLVAGGISGGVIVNSAEIYDTNTETFTAVTAAGHSLTTARTGLTATMLNGGMVIAIGGSTTTDFSGALATAESYTQAFDPTGTVNASSSDNTDTVGSSCTLTRSGTGATTCSVTDTPAHVGTGTHTVTGAYQPAPDNTHSASSGHSDLTVTKADQTITFTGAPASAVYNTTFMVSASASSGLAVTLGASGACSINGMTVTMTSGTGTCNLTADQAGNSDYKAASQATQSTLAQKADQTITFGALADKTFGDPAFMVSATASSGLAVSFSSTTALTCGVAGHTVTIMQAGACTVKASQPGDNNYNAAPDVSRSFNINKATPAITWAKPADITYGTALSATQLNASASFNSSTVAGVFVYTPAAGTVLNAGSGQTLSVNFTPSNTTDYNGAMASVLINVNKAALTATAADAMRPYGADNPAFTGMLVGVVNNDNITVTFTTTATKTSAPGPYAIVPVLVDPNNRLPNYMAALVNGTLTVTKASTTTTISSSHSSSVVGEPVTFSINVTNSSNNTGIPTGTVTILDGSTPIAIATLDGSGNASFTTALLSSAGSPHSINAHFNGDPNFLASDTAPAMQTVGTRPTSAALSFNPPQGTYGTPDTITATVTDTATAGPVGTPDSFGGGAGGLGTSRRDATATQLWNGLILVAGGRDASGTALATAELYNPATGTSTPTGGNLTTARAGAAAALLSDGRVLVAGGDAGGTAEIYDPANDSFTLTGSLNTPRTGAAAVLLGSSVALIGGSNGSPLATVEVFSAGTFTLASGSGLITARFGHVAALLTSGPNSGKILIAGGNDGTSTLNSAELYDPSTNGSTAVTSTLSAPREYAGGALMPNGYVLIAGGDSGGAPLGTTDLYDPAANAFFAGSGTLGTARAELAAVQLNDGRVLAVGGMSAMTAALPSTELYTPAFTPQGVVAISSSASSPADNLTGTCQLVPSLPVSGNAQSTCSETIIPESPGDRTVTGSYPADSIHGSSSQAPTFHVQKASVTASVTASDRVYDGTNSASVGACTLAGVFPMDAGNVTCTAGSATFSDKNVGNGKTVTAINITLGGTAAGNYMLSSTNATTTASIMRRPLMVSAAGISRVYDGTTAATVTLSDDRIAGDVFTDSYTSAAFSNKNAGMGKTVTVIGITISGADAGNYTPNTTTTTTADITKKSLTVTATGVDKVYDATTAATVNLADNRVSGDVFTDSYASATFADKSVGMGKAVNVTGILISGTDAGNYTSNTTANTTANITARPLTVTATGVNRVYDGTTAATVTLSDNRVSGDVFTDSYTSAAFSDKNVGMGKTVTVNGISIAGTDAGNYMPSNMTASTTANITAKSLTVYATGVSKVYDRMTTAAVTLSDNRVSGDAVNDNYTSAAFSDKNIGMGKAVNVSGITLSGTDAGNYTFNTTAMTTANITARALTIAAVGVNKVFDGTTAATVTLSDNRVAGDVFTYGNPSASFMDPNVGQAKPVMVTGISISGADAGNYTFNTTAGTTATITPASTTTILISSNNPSLFGAPLTFTATVNPQFGGLPTGTVQFKDGTAVLGAPVAMVAGVATLKNSTLTVGTHSITALYNADTNFTGSTSNTVSQGIGASGMIHVQFGRYEIEDDTPKPKVNTSYIGGAKVRVYTRKDSCTDGLVVTNQPKIWGKIFDGINGPGADMGCTPVKFGTYTAEGITDATGQVNIVVPPTTTSPNTDYVVIGRTCIDPSTPFCTEFDDPRTMADPDALYSGKEVNNIKSGEMRTVGLKQLRMYNGKKVPAKYTEDYGSYLAIIEPEYVDWTDPVEQYPFVMEAVELWDVTTDVAPPEGFVADYPTLQATVQDTTSAVQFTLTDVGSDWSQTVVTHTIQHKGKKIVHKTNVPMFNKQKKKK